MNFLNGNRSVCEKEDICFNLQVNLTLRLPREDKKCPHFRKTYFIYRVFCVKFWKNYQACSSIIVLKNFCKNLKLPIETPNYPLSMMTGCEKLQFYNLLLNLDYNTKVCNWLPYQFQMYSTTKRSHFSACFGVVCHEWMLTAPKLHRYRMDGRVRVGREPVKLSAGIDNGVKVCEMMERLRRPGMEIHVSPTIPYAWNSTEL